MRTAHDYGGFRKVILHNDVKECPFCREATEFAYRSDRHLVFLNGAQHLFYDVHRCGNKKCPFSEAGYKPSSLVLLALPHHQYSLEVVASIGFQRVKRSLTFAQIAQDLRERCHIQISDREVQYLFDVYAAMVGTPIEQDPARLERLKEQGRIVLSIDAAQPEMDGDALWLFRDQLSGEPLRALTCRSMTAQGIAEEIRKIKALGIPIQGVISDGQNIIIQGIEKALPGVPHQLCQLHFLKDFAKPVTEADRTMQADLKQRVGRGLRAFERAAQTAGVKDGVSGGAATKIPAPATVVATVPTGAGTAAGSAHSVGHKPPRVTLARPLDEGEAKLVAQLCELARAILKTPGRPPLQAPGLKVHEDLKRLLDALEEGLSKKRGRAEPS